MIYNLWYTIRFLMLSAAFSHILLSYWHIYLQYLLCSMPVHPHCFIHLYPSYCAYLQSSTFIPVLIPAFYNSHVHQFLHPICYKEKKNPMLCKYAYYCVILFMVLDFNFRVALTTCWKNFLRQNCLFVRINKLAGPGCVVCLFVRQASSPYLNLFWHDWPIVLIPVR